MISNAQLAFTLAYQLPGIALGILLGVFARHPLVYALVTFPGTLIHELQHFVVGLVLNARPASFTLIPSKTPDGSGWTLGSVGFYNIRWYNAFFVSMAPLITPIVLSAMFTPNVNGWNIRTEDLTYWAWAGPIYAGCIPSGVDFRMSLKSWPLFAMGLLIAGQRYQLY